MAHVFISYSRKDKALVEQLEKQLSEYFDVWIDHKMKRGKKWREELNEHIKACSVLVLFMTPHSLESEVVRYEWIFALGAGKHLIPVYLKEVTTKIPYPLEDFNYLDFRDAWKIDVLINDIADLLQVDGVNKTQLPKYVKEKRDSAWEGTEKTRQSAIDDLTKYNDETLVKNTLLDIMNDAPFLDAKVYAAIVLSKNYQDQRALEGLFFGLKNRNPYWEQVVDEILKLKDLAVDGLIEILDAEYYKARHQTVKFIGAWGIQKAADKLLLMLETEKNDEVYAAIAITMSKLKDNRAVPLLVERVLKHEFFNNDVVLALQEFQDERSILVWLEVLKKSVGFLKPHAHDALVALGRAVVAPIIEELSQECSEGNVYYLGDLLAIARELRYPEFYDVVSYHLSCYEADVVRRQAVRFFAIPNLGERKIITKIEEILQNDRSVSVRIACVRTLGAIDDKETMPYLYACLHDKIMDIKANAIEALASKNLQETEAILVNLLNDEDYPLHLKIIRELEESTNENTKAAIEAWKKSQNTNN